MVEYVALRQSHVPPNIFAGLERLLQVNRPWHAETDWIPQWRGPNEWTDPRDAFSSAAAFIETHRSGSSRLTVIVDEVDPFALSLLGAASWSALIAMLIMAFPEVPWGFRIVKGCPAEKKKQNEWLRFVELHGVGSLISDSGGALFDGCGLRDWVLSQIREIEERPERSGASLPLAVPRRPNLASVLDEEKDFHLIVGLMAYSRGFRVLTFANWSEVTAWLGPNGLLTPPVDSECNSVRADIRRLNHERFELSLEDWYLNFPDQDEFELSRLKHRATKLPALNFSTGKGPRRRFLTVAGSRGERQDQERERDLKEFLDAENHQFHKAVTRGEQVTFKPISGLYQLWNQIGLNRADTRASDFLWPPRKPDDDEQRIASHSSPGRVLQVAEHLLERSAGLRSNAATVKEAVRGAVLCTQALELLACRTPTLSAEALARKHEFEVIAECQFVGVEFHLLMDERLKDIEQTLTRISDWLHDDRKSEFVNNTTAVILTRLSSILSANGQFEESEHCRNLLRECHHDIIDNEREKRNVSTTARFKWLRSSGGKLVPAVGRVLHWYVDSVMRSSKHFVVAILCWLILFASAFWALGYPPRMAFHSAISAMFTVGLVAPEECGGRSLGSAVLSYFAALVGIVNNGLLLAYIYGRITRK